MTRPELSAEDILVVLNRHRVDYVVIGAFAAIAQGAPLEATHDVDVTPRRDIANLRRLSAALTELEAGIRVDDLDEGLAFAHDPTSLAGMAMLNLTCAPGDFDIVFAPAGSPSGYEELIGNSVLIRVGEVEVSAASVEDVLRSKEEVGREKDVRAVLVLRAFLRDRPE
ncbi:MAG TPA: hypothetical protein VGG38_21280 [Acidimicrobiales bacterium]